MGGREPRDAASDDDDAFHERQVTSGLEMLSDEAPQLLGPLVGSGADPLHRARPRLVPEDMTVRNPQPLDDPAARRLELLHERVAPVDGLLRQAVGAEKALPTELTGHASAGQQVSAAGLTALRESAGAGGSTRIRTGVRGNYGIQGRTWGVRRHDWMTL